MPPFSSQPSSTPFGNIRGYLLTLHDLAAESSNESWEQRCSNALNGEASNELRRLVPIEVRREFGAFFTGSYLSTQLLSHGSRCGPDSIFYDPTCGMGDLLLAVAKILPLGRTLQETLKVWGQQLSGTDLHPEFVEGTKTRLVLLARQRHQADRIAIDASVEYFPYIHVADALGEQAEFQRATCILMNPPFGAISAPDNCTWGSGRITAAALFVTSILERATPGTEVLAILPEVLRSGSFSDRWRNKISELAEVQLVESFGIFDESADVDVFLLRLVRRQAHCQVVTMNWPSVELKAATTISDFFNVHVGRVVPYRDDESGQHYAYIHPRCVPLWTEMTEFSETRSHQGKAYLPPFVAIRRTSRPEQPYRAAATVIGGNQPVFVENHLIVCEPKDGNLATCRELMKQLRSDTVNDFLNERIRCRHLTVTAIRDIPFAEVVR